VNPAPRASASSRQRSLTLQINAGQNNVNSPDLGMGDMSNANIQVTSGQVVADATARTFTASGNVNGTINVAAAVNATGNTLVDVLVTP